MYYTPPHSCTLSSLFYSSLYLFQYHIISIYTVIILKLSWLFLHIYTAMRNAIGILIRIIFLDKFWENCHLSHIAFTLKYFYLFDPSFMAYSIYYSNCNSVSTHSLLIQKWGCFFVLTLYLVTLPNSLINSMIFLFSAWQ